MAAKRILFSTTSGMGHFMPLVPLIDAAQKAGNTVAVASPAESAEMVTNAGFAHLTFDGVDPNHPARISVFSQIAHLSDDERRTLVGREIFGRLNTSAALPGMIRNVADWQPDVVVSESAEMSAPIAAEIHSIPVSRVHPGIAGAVSEFFDAQLALGIDELRLQNGLPSDADAALLRAVSQFAYFPEEFDPAPASMPLTRIRDARYSLPSNNRQSDLAYVTFGSEAGSMPFIADVLRQTVDAVTAAGMRAVVSIGAADPKILAQVPPTVTVERWVNTAEIMQSASLVVCHAGAGTTLAAMSSGLPIVAVPLFADQPINAARIEATDCGRSVSMGPDLAGRIEQAVRSVIDSPPLGSARLAEAMQKHESPEFAVARIEAFVAQGRAITPPPAGPRFGP